MASQLSQFNLLTYGENVPGIARFHFYKRGSIVYTIGAVYQVSQDIFQSQLAEKTPTEHMSVSVYSLDTAVFYWDHIKWHRAQGPPPLPPPAVHKILLLLLLFVFFAIRCLEQWTDNLRENCIFAPVALNWSFSLSFPRYISYNKEKSIYYVGSPFCEFICLLFEVIKLIKLN